MKAFILLTIIFIHHFAYSQNIGIGTMNPSDKIQINSLSTLGRPTLKLFDSSSVSGPTIEFQTTSSTNYWQMKGRLHPTD